MLDSKPGQIEAGRWYDLKVMVSGKNVKCYRDGKVVHDLDYGSSVPIVSLYAVAATDRNSQDVILKVVNVNAQPMETKLDFTGAKLLGTGTATVLTSENATDENSLATPTKVAPKPNR